MHVDELCYNGRHLDPDNTGTRCNISFSPTRKIFYFTFRLHSQASSKISCSCNVWFVFITLRFENNGVVSWYDTERAGFGVSRLRFMFRGSGAKRLTGFSRSKKNPRGSNSLFIPFQMGGLGYLERRFSVLGDLYLLVESVLSANRLTISGTSPFSVAVGLLKTSTTGGTSVGAFKTVSSTMPGFLDS